jgi:hypothetical protein
MGDEDTSRMLGGEVDDDDIVERMSKIFKDMPPYMPCPVPEYSTAHPPNKVSSRDRNLLVHICLVWSYSSGLCTAG